VAGWNTGTALDIKLQSARPPNSNEWGLESTISYAVVTCVPAARYSQSSPFAYSLWASGTESIAAYNLDDVKTFFHARLQGLVPPNYLLIQATISGIVQDEQHATLTQIVVYALSCSGIAGYDWSASRLHDLAVQIAGLDQATAFNLVRYNPGVYPPSVQITLSAGTQLPSDPSKIAFKVADGLYHG
jgi:hypothetical protein